MGSVVALGTSQVVKGLQAVIADKDAEIAALKASECQSWEGLEPSGAIEFGNTFR